MKDFNFFKFLLVFFICFLTPDILRATPFFIKLILLFHTTVLLTALLTVLSRVNAEFRQHNFSKTKGKNVCSSTNNLVSYIGSYIYYAREFEHYVMSVTRKTALYQNCAQHFALCNSSIWERLRALQLSSFLPATDRFNLLRINKIFYWVKFSCFSYQYIVEYAS